MATIEPAREDVFSLKLDVPVRYSVYGETRDDETRETIFLLHGYGETKERIYKRFAAILQRPRTRVLAINGPFPVPIQKDGEFHEAYAWYFYSMKQQRTVIDPTVCDPLFQAIIERESVLSRPARVIGYSQGGFMIPIVARLIPTLKHAIAVSTGYRRERYAAAIPYRLDAVHGESDEVLNFATAAADYAKVRAQAAAGEFKQVTAGHRIDAVVTAAVKNFIDLQPL